MKTNYLTLALKLTTSFFVVSFLSVGITACHDDDELDEMAMEYLNTTVSADSSLISKIEVKTLIDSLSQKIANSQDIKSQDSENRESTSVIRETSMDYNQTTVYNVIPKNMLLDGSTNLEFIQTTGTTTNSSDPQIYTYNNGGAIYANNDVVISPSGTFIPTKTEQIYGGAIYNSGSVEITHSSFVNNYTSDKGGAIYTNKEVETLSSGTFIPTKTEQIYGGAIYNSGSVEITHSSFVNNYTSDYGGAIYANKEVETLSSGTFIPTVTEQIYGGAIYNSGSVEITHNSFVNNYTSDYGGAIYANCNNELKLEDCHNIKTAEQEVYAGGIVGTISSTE